MPSAFEIAPSGRARCRGCGKRIAKDALRFGERMPNPFGDGEMTLWFHPVCGALKRPEPFLETLSAADVELDDRDALEAMAREGLRHRRLPRLHDVERAPSGRARCRSCRELIERGTWRIALVYYQEGRFEPSGTIHLRCAGAYFETTDIVSRLSRLRSIPETDLAEIARQLTDR
jgi:hypothetical protein